jgi:hypothetical protein
MAESLPSPKSYYRVVGGSDDSWTEIVDDAFQAELEVEYEVVCVKPSDIADVIWTDE